MNKFVWITGLLGLALLLPTAERAAAQDAAPILKKQDSLTTDDPFDKFLKGSRAKHFPVKLEKGKTYRIDMVSREIDPIVRLENPSGRQVGIDDDGGGYPNARLVYQAVEDGEHTIIASSFGQPMGQFKLTGEFTLTVQIGSVVDQLEARAKGIAAAPPAERVTIVNDLKKHFQGLKGQLTFRETGLAMNLAQTLERIGPKQAIEVYKDFGKIFSEASDERVAGVGRSFEGCARRIGLVGNTMEVKGKSFDGKDIDLAKMKGKVVLVDFWATWCGPCIGEIPSMQRMYKAYHDRGFEIIAVSVDQSVEAPTKFMEQRKLPWPCIHDSRVGGKSLSDYYGVMSIPLPILVDREGKVVSLNARGQELERLLEKHIGPVAEDKN